MDESTIRSLCEEAALWWAEKCSGRSVHDNGDRSPASFFCGILADLQRELVSEEKKVLFSEILASKLYDEAVKRRNEKGAIWLSCDYGPEPFLSDAAREAGILPSNFPWKTSMCIDLENEKVIVQDGYGAPYTVIFKINKEE